VHPQIEHLKNLRSDTVILRAVCSFNNEHNFNTCHAALSNRFYNRQWNVFIVRYELNVQLGEIFKLHVSQ
jgi:hypothetical protein